MLVNQNKNAHSENISTCGGQIHGLRTPDEAFFHRNPKILGLGREIGQINFGAYGIF